MAAPSSDYVEVEAEVLDLGVAADLDTATSRIFFSDGDDDAGGAESSWPAAEGITSTLTTQDTLRALCGTYGVPAVYTPHCADHVGWAARACATPPEGSNTICVYAGTLDAGLRFPLHGFYAKLLRHYRLAPSQLAPNSWGYMAAFVLLCEDAGVEPLVSVFRYFFTICAHKDATGNPSGWHHFQPYGDGSRGRLFTGNLPSKFGWRSRFFFLESSPATPWPCPTKWGKPRRADAPKQQRTSTAIETLLTGKTGVDVKWFLLSRRHNLPVGLLTSPEPATVKAEARTAAAAAVAAETRKRKSSPEAAAVTPPPQQSMFPAMSTPPDFSPDQRVHGSGSESFLLPPGMWAADALQLWEAVAEKTQLQDKKGTADAKHAAEVAELKRELREAKDWGSQLMGFLRAAGDEVARLKEEHAAELAHLMDHLRAAGSEVTQLEEQASLKDKEHAAEIGRLTEEHAAGVARLKEEHAAEVKDAAAKEAQAAKAQAKKEVVLALFPDLDPSMLERASQGTADL